MTIEEIQQRLREGLGEAAAGRLHAAARDPWIVVPVESLQAVCFFLRDDPQLQFEMLNDLTLVDYLETDPKKKTPHEPRMELVYHLSSVTLGHRVVIKAHLPRLAEGAADAFPHVPSVTSIWAGADWHEREAFDMFGVRFQGHPNLQRILCAEDWQGHPLRKDYPFPEEYHGIRAY